MGQRFKLGINEGKGILFKRYVIQSMVINASVNTAPRDKEGQINQAK